MSRNPFKTEVAADHPLTLARVADMVASCTPGYRLVKFLGEGSYGRVYLLQDALKQVVVKLVPLTYRTPQGEADRDASGWDWFQLQSRLDHMHHPSLVRVRDFFRVDSTDVDDPVAAYGLIYMDYWAASLRRCVRRWHREQTPSLLRRVMLWQQVVRLVRDVQRDTGLLYTDLKPANILMSDCTADAPRLVLGDPGGLHRQGGAALDRVDATRKYLPPEVQDGMAAEVDERALIFSLGIIGFFILEGRLPFSSLPEDAHAHVRVSEGVALDWQDSSDDPLLVQVQQLVGACLAAEPGQRPASFAALYDQLAQLVRQLSQAAVSLPPLASRQAQAVWQEPTSGLRLVWVPAGDVLVGQSAAETALLKQRYGESRFEGWFSRELPQHRVAVSGFWMSETPVTVAQFTRFTQQGWHATDAEQENWAHAWTPEDDWQVRTGISWRQPGFEQGEDHPVVCVSWFDAQAYCRWLSRITGLTVALPSEAQWEHACRAGTRSAYAGGDQLDAGQAHFSWPDKAKLTPLQQRYRHRTAPVGQYAPNALGLYDLHGNVWEWCRDRFDASFYQRAEASLPDALCQRETGLRPRRGGSWNFNAWFLRTAYRGKNYPDARYSDIGFRVVVLPEGHPLAGQDQD